MTVFEQELLIRVENGMVVETRLVDNRGKDLDTIYKELGYDFTTDSEADSLGEVEDDP